MNPPQSRSVGRLAAGVLAAVVTALGQPLSAAPEWKFTIEEPAEGWEQPAFSDAKWQTGTGGFGNTEGAVAQNATVHTEWTTADIWLRRKFDLKEIPAKPALFIYHDDEAEVYLNGQRVAILAGYTEFYSMVPLEGMNRDALKKGSNLIAVHCHQGRGAQYVDAHVIDSDTVPDLHELLGEDGAVRSELMTEWGEKVTPDNVWREYPRPQMKRENWNNLNGTWDYAVTTLDVIKPETWAGTILVPFPIESKLSGVRRMLQPYEALWYRRTVNLSPTPGKRTLLHFGAVDYRCQVWVNEQEVGAHVGGNLPFHFDITDDLRDGDNVLMVRVEDATGGIQLRGKQVLKPGGIMYTRNSGIWQSVWTEEVSRRHIERLAISTDIKASTITIRPELEGKVVVGETLHAEVLAEGEVLGTADGELVLRVPDAKLWSPASPHLYDLKVSLLDPDGKVIDEVTSYAGLREVGRERDADGNFRFTLNGKPVFHWGPLDQGWWPDGLLAPPSDEAIRWEIQWLKDAGFNMIRKHIKVEPERYYYHCDRIGMMVWQDQVSGGESPPWTHLKPDPEDALWQEWNRRQWLTEFDEMITHLGNFPSIVVWTPFNEAWGQHRTMSVGKWAMDRDPSRLINIASGGNFWPIGHIADEHSYPDPGFPLDDDRFKDYVKVVGEFGGHGWPVADHLWDPKKENWGYGGLPKSLDEYRQRYEKSIGILAGLKAKGISGGVYTQTTDVEEEINGLMTYDRKVQKIPAAELKKINAPLTAGDSPAEAP
ncbi:glycoside hydrolase family 2 protein [Luteolibacter marinus]|uniref:glycoside hydrolase family 2 protein n=1 Tax=Luteolibacter marinus TaxID=2776705 RepID=UPI001865B165|nr:sugar-binding domain-containing protein [Luteolibacter marinus]